MWVNQLTHTLGSIQTCTSASKDVKKCRFWRVTYTFGPTPTPVADRLPRNGAAAPNNHVLCTGIV